MKILVAVDGSVYAEAVVGLVAALRIGRKSGATIVTVIPEQVFPGGRTLADLLGRTPALRAQLRKAEEARAVELLAGPAKTLGDRGLAVETSVRRGNPADEIMKACRTLRPDLVLVGAKGTSAIAEFSLGSVAHKVMKYAPCSVLVAKKESKSIDRVLVPIDGSRYSDEVVQFLLRIPLPRRAEIVLMTVVQPWAAALVRAYGGDAEGSRRIIAELRGAEEEAAQRLMTEAERHLQGGGYKVSLLVARGDPSQEILREAGEQRVDLVALGAKGLTGVRRFLLGSVSQRVARYAEPSVLIVRPPGK
jgi:nucleotide-binding universal stress UspA family protein